MPEENIQPDEGRPRDEDQPRRRDENYQDEPRRARHDYEDDRPRRRYRDDDDDYDVRRRDDGDATGGLIPYKNPMALIGYYLGVFSLIPCAGLLLGPAALILGILGLRYKSRHPTAGGTAHAIVAIVLGALVLLAHAAFFAIGAAGGFK